MSEQQGKLPLDAKLLADTVIELNISRRSVGFYPAEHPHIRESISRAFGYFEKLFEIRNEITLGIAADTLIIDEYTLDRKNPVFREFANLLHSCGVAAVTFVSGLEKEELVSLHEILSLKELPPGKTLTDLLREKDVRRITFALIDLTNFSFIEGAKRGGEQGNIWEDYVFGLLEGRLGGTGESGLLGAAPSRVAEAVNQAMPVEAGPEAYDRVITAYIRKKDHSHLSSEALSRFYSFVEDLRPELKRQFLSRSLSHFTADVAEVERALGEMSREDFAKIVSLLAGHTSLIPDTLKNLLDKLSSIKQEKRGMFDSFYRKSAVLDDIDLGEDVLKLFGDDQFSSFVSDDYKKQLEAMLSTVSGESCTYDKLREQCREETIDRTNLDILLELLDAAFVKPDDYLTMVTRLTEMVEDFMGTGRFEEVLEAYNALKSHELTRRFSNEASSAIDYYYHSPEFIGKFVGAMRLYGRKDRDATVRLARALRRSLIEPLISSLAEEKDAAMRKFYLAVLAAIGTDVQPHAVKRLGDGRWYVVRNMLYLLRECQCRRAADSVRRLVRHNNPQISLEAVKTLLHFGTPDAVPYLKTFLQNGDATVRSGAVRLAGSCRVKDAVPILLQLLDKKDLLGLEAFYKTDIVRALGDIGDPAAIPSLIRLCRSRVLIYREHLDDLKIEVFRSLGGYPAEAVLPLLAMGRESKNPAIREACEQFASQTPGREPEEEP